jgi:hypothetical protein
VMSVKVDLAVFQKFREANKKESVITCMLLAPCLCCCGNIERGS